MHLSFVCASICLLSTFVVAVPSSFADNVTIRDAAALKCAYTLDFQQFSFYVATSGYEQTTHFFHSFLHIVAS